MAQAMLRSAGPASCKPGLAWGRMSCCLPYLVSNGQDLQFHVLQGGFLVDRAKILAGRREVEVRHLAGPCSIPAMRQGSA